MLVYCVHPAVAMHLIVLVRQNDVGNNSISSGFGGLSENGLCVVSKLCPVSFLVVGRRFCCIILSCRVLSVVMMGRWSDDNACPRCPIV